MTLGRLTLSFVILQGLVACASTTANIGRRGDTVVRKAKVAPLAVDLRNVALTPGSRWVNLASPAPVQRRMVLMVPDETERAEPRPLVIFLHGASAAKLPERLECLVAPAFARIAPPIVLAPEMEGGQWWNETETAFVLGLADAAVRDWRAVNSKHRVVMGYSNGGIGAWFFARLYPERFSAAIPMSANHEIVGESPLPIRVIHGSHDALFDVNKVRERVHVLSQAGFDVSLEVREGGRHQDACGYERQLEAAALWLENSVWREPPPAN